MENIPDGRKGALIYHCRGIVRSSSKFRICSMKNDTPEELFLK